jgi:hypothetical protein
MRNRSHAAMLTGVFFVATSLLLPDGAWAKEDEFKTIVNHLSIQYHKRPMRFMGFLSFVANRFNPAGVSDLKMAIFEDLDPSCRLAGSGIDVVQQAATLGGFKPFVRITSRRDGEQTFIYAREAKQKYEMIIVVLEEEESVVLRMTLSTEVMADWVMEPERRGKNSIRENGQRKTRKN